MKDFTVYINEKLKITNKMLKQNQYDYHPESKKELIDIIKAEIYKNGWECDLNHIDVTQITDMSYLFSSLTNGFGLGDFNGDISKWDVSKVTNMRAMFWGAKSFNQPIGDWKVSEVKNMKYMFYEVNSFNQPIGDWDVSNVEYMESMFCLAKSFNQDLSNWEIKTTCNTNSMFISCPIEEKYKPKFNK